MEWNSHSFAEADINAVTIYNLRNTTRMDISARITHGLVFANPIAPILKRWKASQVKSTKSFVGDTMQKWKMTLKKLKPGYGLHARKERSMCSILLCLFGLWIICRMVLH